VRVLLDDVTKTYADRSGRAVEALAGVSLTAEDEELLAIVGPSGCGKSTLLNMVAGLLAPSAGSIAFEGELPAGRPPTAMVFQEFALFPWRTVQTNVELGLEERGLPAAERRVVARRFIELTGLGGFEGKYPHQLSGGMRQRIMIAMALSCNPNLLIADEPTTALDVTIQAQILDLLNELKSKLHMAVLLITHDMGVIAETAQRVVVMYAAKVAEEASVADLFKEPLHPYTQGLLRSIPRIDLAATTHQRLETIPGTVPTLRGEIAPGCRFAPRCPFVKSVCTEKDPVLKEVKPGHKVSCWLY